MDIIPPTESKFLVRTQNLIRSKYGLWLLGLISFTESCLTVPIVVDPFLIIYILANRSQALAGIMVTTLASVVGGIVAYLIAYWFQPLVLSLLGPEATSHFFILSEQFQHQTVVLTLLGTILPLPYTFMSMAIGFMKGNLFLFILGSVLGRGIRFALVGYLTYRFGPQALRYLRANLLITTSLVLAILLGYLVWVF